MAAEDYINTSYDLDDWDDAYGIPVLTKEQRQRYMAKKSLREAINDFEDLTKEENKSC